MKVYYIKVDLKQTIQEYLETIDTEDYYKEKGLSSISNYFHYLILFFFNNLLF